MFQVSNEQVILKISFRKIIGQIFYQSYLCIGQIFMNSIFIGHKELNIRQMICFKFFGGLAAGGFVWRVRRKDGATVRRYNSTTLRWYDGVAVRRCDGAMVRKVGMI